MKTIAPLIAVLLIGSLAGCGDNHSDLTAYVASIKARAPQPIEPLPAVARYQPFVYVPGGRRAPFMPTQRATQPSQHQSHSGIQPDTNRPTEPLERFPLDSLHMAGTITSGGITYALISAPDHILHRVKRGDHLGQKYGEIESISDKGITITEIVPDGTGGYTKRGAALVPSG